VPSLRGQLLVASPALVDPNFRRTVVLVGEHGEEGAMGLVLNRPSETTVDDAVPPLAGLAGGGAGATTVHVGGPVQPEAIVVLAEFEEPERAASLVVGHVGFVPGEVEDDDDLGALVRVRVFAGYAGWGAGQLEQELREGAWIVVDAEPGDAFADDTEGLWSAVLRRRGGPYAVLARMPADPRVN
jgi:putative transcriptional regulator